jgi:GntR family transcriptional regulator
MDAEMPLPKYHQVYLVLREQLHEGKFSQGVPSELALMQHFSVARVTVRRALAQLAQEGLISREPGRGTRSLLRRNNPHSNKETSNQTHKAQLTGLLENLVSMGLRTSVKVLSIARIPAPLDISSSLQIHQDEFVQKAQRVRFTKEGPLSHITTWVPEAIASGFGKKELESKPILVLLEESGVKVGRAQQSISAKLADANVSQHLEVAIGSALLSVNRLIFDIDDKPIQWLHGLYRPDRYEYQMQLSRVGSIDAKVWVSKELSANFH